MEMKEKILKSVFNAMEQLEKDNISTNEMQMIIGGVAMGVESVLENIEDDIEVRREIARKIINESQNRYIRKSKRFYWEDIK